MSLNDYIGGGADATFDEFAIWDFGGAAGGIAWDPMPRDATITVASRRHKDGRYYKGSAYAAPFAPPVSGAAGSWISAPLSLPRGAALREIRWTWIRPSALPNDYAELELLNPAADNYLWSPALSGSTQASGWTRDLQSWRVDAAPTTPFRLRAVFRRETAVDADTPILDSPVLDDLTVLYDLPGGPRMTSWEEGER